MSELLIAVLALIAAFIIYVIVKPNTACKQCGAETDVVLYNMDGLELVCSECSFSDPDF